MIPMGMAMMILFGGQNLDGWISLAGQWQVRKGAIVCTMAPAVIRTSYEADECMVQFQYRQAGNGDSRLFVHSRMMAGGTEILLTSSGALLGGDRAGAGQSLAQDRWIDVQLEMSGGQLQVTSSSEGAKLHAASCAIAPGSRGFLRFQARKPGLEIRQVCAEEPGFRLMFGGDKLDEWETVNLKNPDDPGWVLKDGILECRGHKSGWLRTLRTYQDFVLRLEYQLPPRGNSGIFVRAPIEGRVSRNGLEIQLLDDFPFYGEIKPAGHTGSVYDGIAPEVRVPAPADAWNAIEVYLDGRRIRTTLNGVQLYDASLDDAAKDENHDKRPLTTRRAVGFIGLQDHSTTVRFRNVRIRELD